MKVPGMCSVCGEECFEVIQWHQQGPFNGEPAKLGGPHEGACRVTMVQVDGCQISFTVHDRCVDSISLPALWHSVMERLVFEDKNRKALRQKELTDEQQAQFDEHSLKFYDNRPLGILAVERWQDVSTD